MGSYFTKIHDNDLEKMIDIQIDPKVLDHYRDILKKTPCPDESTVTDFPSPAEYLRILEKIQETGKGTVDDLRYYECVRQSYEALLGYY